LTDCNSSGRTLIEQKIARAYTRLKSIPDDPKALVLLASIGRCEIRMLRDRSVHADCVPLFWLELFDHNTTKSVDSFSCHRIHDAVPVFEDSISQAAELSKLGRPEV
jgi:hypothetical protein